MVTGSEAVKAELTHEFRPGHIEEDVDFDTKDVVLRFSAEGRDYTVNVTREFNDDYPSGQVRVKLNALGDILRRSATGLAKVTRRGILG